jgi:hypothetical protein
MQCYRIITDLKFDRPISNDIANNSSISNLNTEIQNLSVSVGMLRVFADSDLHNVSWNEDIQTYYNSTDIADNFIWRVDNEKLYSIQTTDSRYPLSTLHYILTNILSGEYSVSGSVIMYKIGDLESYKCIVYDVVNSNISYHTNKSLDLTKHWDNCNYFVEEGEVEDIYCLPSHFTKFNDNSFQNLILNCFPDNTTGNVNILDDLEPEEIFETTYKYVCI